VLLTFRSGMAPHETLASYQVTRFPVFVATDKSRRIRDIGPEGYFDADESVDRLVKRLVTE